MSIPIKYATQPEQRRMLPPDELLNIMPMEVMETVGGLIWWLQLLSMRRENCGSGCPAYNGDGCATVSHGEHICCLAFEDAVVWLCNNDHGYGEERGRFISQESRSMLSQEELHEAALTHNQREQVSGLIRWLGLLVAISRSCDDLCPSYYDCEVIYGETACYEVARDVLEWLGKSYDE